MEPVPTALLQAVLASGRTAQGLRLTGADLRHCGLDGLRADDLDLNEAGLRNASLTLLGALHQADGSEPPPETRTLIRRLGRGLGLGDRASVEQVLARLTGRDPRSTWLPTNPIA